MYLDFNKSATIKVNSISISSVEFGEVSIKRDCEDVIRLFNQSIGVAYRTRLVGGGIEPEYIPAGNSAPYHQIIFTHDYFASALHELAHWCVAGEQRRLQHDYGYWYAPDGRTPEQQQAFEQVEVKPQALEWMFSRACGVPFRVSADNLDAGLGASLEFKQAIVAQAHGYCDDVSASTFNERAQRLIDVLVEFYCAEGSCSRAENSMEESGVYQRESYVLADLL